MVFFCRPSYFRMAIIFCLISLSHGYIYASEEDTISEANADELQSIEEDGDTAAPGENATINEHADHQYTGREGTRADLGILWGYATIPIPGFGVSFAYHVSENFYLGLSFASGSADFREFLRDTEDRYQTSISKADAISRLTLLTSQYHIGNSLYFSAGLGQRLLAFDYRVKSLLADEEQFSHKTTTMSAVINFGIGNNWNMASGLIFGVQWIGLSIPLAHSKMSSDQDPPEGTLSGQNLQDQESSIDRMIKKFSRSTTYSALMIKLGWNF